MAADTDSSTSSKHNSPVEKSRKTGTAPSKPEPSLSADKPESPPLGNGNAASSPGNSTVNQDDSDAESNVTHHSVASTSGWGIFVLIFT